jgi:hypothetical protein
MILLFCIGFFFFVGAISAQNQQPPGSPVAILVVDVFDVIEESVTQPDTETTCVFTIDGQDGFKWQGFADELTSILHPVADTHGEQVYGIIDALLTDHFSASGVAATPIPSELWLRDMKVWNDNEIYLVGIDTDAYTSDLMVTRIKNTIEAFYGVGITNFVINMSFAVIPCAAFPRDRFTYYTDVLNTDYTDELNQAMFAELSAACDEQAQALIEGGQTQEPPRFGELDSNANCLDLAALADDLDPPPNLEEQSQQAAKLLLEVFSAANFQPVREVVYFTFLRPQIPVILQAAYPAVNPPRVLGDSFMAFFANNGGLQQFCTDLGEGVNCVAVASAGNDGRNFPYAPASLPSVISASARYELPGCTQQELTNFEGLLTDVADKNPTDSFDTLDVADIIFELTTPRSNDGEVQMDGVLDEQISEIAPCLRFWGTSYAAPRLSYEMAIHLFDGKGLGQCSGEANVAGALTTFTSEPPLNYADGPSGIWENLELSAAIAKYCDTF